MKRTLSMSILLVVGTVLHASAREQVIRSVDWKALASAHALTSGAATADGALRVTHRGAGLAQFHLVTIERPAITAFRYAVRGRIRYEQVAAGSYLEMFNYIGDGSYFSRTLGDGGPMGQLSGSSTWREFVLPFTNREDGPAPTKLVINLVLKGSGTVDIGPLELVQYDRTESFSAGGVGWWSDRHAGIAGAIAGSLLGVLGVLIGALGSAARAKTFVLGALTVIAVLGVIALGAGLAAVALGQPYGVFYPLLLFGAISTVVGLSLPRVLARRYEAFELRRMQALDV